MTSDIILNGITIYTTKVEELKTKKLITITPPVGTGARSEGPRDTLIVDLLMRETRFNIDGRIEATDRAAFRDILEKNGVVTMSYAGDDFLVDVEKFTITEVANDAGSGNNPDTLVVKLTVMVGINYG